MRRTRNLNCPLTLNYMMINYMLSFTCGRPHLVLPQPFFSANVSFLTLQMFDFSLWFSKFDLQFQVVDLVGAFLIVSLLLLLQERTCRMPSCLLLVSLEVTSSLF